MYNVNENTMRCPICGGPLKEHSYGVKKCTCCNNIFKLKTTSPDLLNRANSLRRANAFEESLSIYKEILEKDPDFPEANWGALLAEYGIEYIDENGKLIPTIHRPINNYKINEDHYASALLKNTSGSDYDYYQNKIDELEKLRLKIEEQNTGRDNYDIFISCKITVPGTDEEEKTPEYEWARKIYSKLTQRGFRVFFSPKSLPASNGDYEPRIYSALQSSRYMIILASQSDYLKSKWIRNEWERFIEIQKRNQGKPKYFKLIINNEVAKDVPEKLKTTQYISRDNKFQWLKTLEQAVIDAFPDYKDLKYRPFDPDIDGVDLSAVGKIVNKLLHPEKVINRANENLIAPSNQYNVSYCELEENYTVEHNVETCCGLVEIQLRNGKFSDANYELHKYLNNFADEKGRNDYNILTMKMLIESKSKDLDEFFTKNISTFDDFELFNRIVKNLPLNKAEEFLSPVSDYIINSIQSRENNNSIEYYKAVCNINALIIKKLNYSVLQCMPYLYGQPELLMQYAELAIPYISANSLQDYINYSSDLATGLCKHGLWKEADKVITDLKNSDPQNSSAALTSLMIENKANDKTVLLTNIEKNNRYVEIENLIPTLYKTGVSSLINVIMHRINELINQKEFTAAGKWMNIVVQTDFDDRDEFIYDIIEKCKNIPDSEDVFYLAIHTLDEDKKDLFMSASITFVSGLIQEGKYLPAKKFCKELNEYDGNNLQVLNYYLLAEMESKTFQYQNITKLHDMSIIEKMLICYPSQSSREDLLNRLINNCISYVDHTDIKETDNVFDVFDKLIVYYKDIRYNRPLMDKIYTFGEKCLEKGFFDKATSYFFMLIRIEKEYHKAYWGLLLATNKCRNDEELICCSKKIDSSNEYYSSAVKFADGDREYEDRYVNVISEMAHYKKKKKRPKIILSIIIPAAVIVLLAIIFILVL